MVCRFYTDPSGTFWQCNAKAIGSGSEGADSSLQEQYNKVCFLHVRYYCWMLWWLVACSRPTFRFSSIVKNLDRWRTSQTHIFFVQSYNLGSSTWTKFYKHTWLLRLRMAFYLQAICGELWWRFIYIPHWLGTHSHIGWGGERNTIYKGVETFF